MIKWTVIVVTLLLIATPCLALDSEQSQYILGGQGQAQGAVIFFMGPVAGHAGYQAQIAGATTGQNQSMVRSSPFEMVAGSQEQSVGGGWTQFQYRYALIGNGFQSQMSGISVSGSQSQNTGWPF